MIRFYLQERIAEKKFETGTKITLDLISKETGVSKITLSRINSQRGYNTTTDNIGKLCRFFECTVDKIMAYVPDEDVKK